MRHLAILRSTHKILWIVALGASLLSMALAAEEPSPAKKSVAEINVATTRIDWVPLVEYEHLVLTVAGPGDFYIQREFSAEESPSFNLLDFQDGQLPDGVYAYELRTVPKAQGLAEATVVQSGHLWVQGGTFVAKVPARPSPPTKETASEPSIRNITDQTTTIPEDLVVQGQACIGLDCGAGDVNGPLLNLKEFGNTQIVLDGGGFHPCARKWSLQANDCSVPSGDFLIRDLTAGTVPFRIGSSLGAPDNAFTIQDSTGNIGLGTLTPGAKLHLFSNATADVFGSAGPNPASGPAFNFGYGGTSFGRGAGFLNVRPDASATAPNPSLRFLTANVERMIITNTGSVGIGTTSPAKRLTVKSAGGNDDVMQVVRSSSSAAVFRVFETSGGDGLVSMFDSAGNEDVRITASGGHGWTSGTLGLNCNSPGGFDFAIKSGTGASTACNTGTYSGIIAGQTTFTVPSSRTIKEDIKPVRVPDILEKIDAIDVYTYNYIEGPKDRIGLMAEDFHQVFERGSDKLISGHEVEMALWLAVKELTKRNQELAERVEQLETQLKGQQP